MSFLFTQYLQENAGVTNEQLEHLKTSIQKRSVQADDVLLRKGDICKHFFYVEQGLLRFYSVNKKGEKNILEFAPEKWLVVDRASFYFDEPSEFYIDAIEQTTVAVLDEQFIDVASELSPQFRKYNERIMQNHIRHLQNRINRLIGKSAEDRYLFFLEKYPHLTSRVPQWMIASFLGITPESLSRIRGKLSNK